MYIYIYIIYIILIYTYIHILLSVLLVHLLHLLSSFIHKLIHSFTLRCISVSINQVVLS